MSTITLEGPVHTWSLVEGSRGGRSWVDVTLPFGQFRTVAKADPFSAASGRGEQRKVQESHVRRLLREMESGNYTPTPMSAGLRPRHRENLTVRDGVARLKVSTDDPIPLTDGLQRTSAIELLRSKLEDDSQKAALDKLPITLRVYIDGDTQSDFINLNQGKAVDSTHLFSLRMRQGLIPGNNPEAIKKAVGAAKALHTNSRSPFHQAIRFDDKSLAPIPVMTVCARGSSDLATSLVGTAMAAPEGADAEDVAKYVTAAYRAIKDNAPELLEPGRLLTPPLPDGTKGSATMLCGLGTCLAYRLRSQNRKAPSPEDLTRLAEAAKETLARPVDGNLSGPAKRKFIGEFAEEYLSDLGEQKHGGVPVGLQKLLSSSTFGCSPLPKLKKPKPKPAKAAAEK